jgi:integrase
MMSKRFELLTRPAMRALAPGQAITEHGIKFERLRNGDGRFTVAFRADGRRILRVVGVESEGVTRSTCEELIAQIKTDARADRLNLPKARKRHMNFEEAANIYIQRLKDSDGKNIAKKDSHLKHHLIPFFKNHTLGSICETEIGRYKKKRKEDGAAIGTINRELATLSHLLNKGLDWGWITTKPRKIGLMKEDNARIIALTPNECQKLLKAAQLLDEQLYLFVRLGLSTGMRHMEILSIALENINLQNREIYLPKTKTGSRMQRISTDTASFLDWYLRTSCRSGQQWLFPARFQTRTGHRTSIDDAFRTAVKNAGLDTTTITPHVMRHTVETRLAEEGVDIKTRMELLGHKTHIMALRYDHVTGQRVKDAADLLEQSLKVRIEII